MAQPRDGGSNDVDVTTDNGNNWMGEVKEGVIFLVTNIFYLFIYLFLTALGPNHCAWAFL